MGRIGRSIGCIAIVLVGGFIGYSLPQWEAEGGELCKYEVINNPIPTNPWSAGDICCTGCPNGGKKICYRLIEVSFQNANGQKKGSFNAIRSHDKCEDCRATFHGFANGRIIRIIGRD